MSGSVRVTAVLAGVFLAMLPLAAVMADGERGKSGSNPDGAGFDKPVGGDSFAAAGGGGTQGPAYFDGNNGCGQDRRQDVAPDHQGGYDDNNGNCGAGEQGGAGQQGAGGNGGAAFGAQAQAQVNVTLQGNAQSNPDAAGLDTPGIETQGPAFFDANNGCGQDKKLDLVADHQGGFDDNNGLCGQVAAQAQVGAQAEVKSQTAVAAAQQAAAAQQQAAVAAEAQAPTAVAAETQAQALPASGGRPGTPELPTLALLLIAGLGLVAGTAMLASGFVRVK